MAWDGSGSLYALGMRLTKLDAAGAPIVGATSVYATDALIKADIGLEYEDGQEVILRSGSGAICVSYQAPKTLKQGTIGDLQVCSPDPNVLQFLIGGNIISRADVDEVQTVTITGTPTGGTFTLTFEGQTTAGIAFDATAAAVETALEALSNLLPGDVAVAGAAGGPYTVTFDGALGNVAQMTGSGASLTGGTSPAVVVATTTGGSDLTDIGYQTPAVGAEATPNGVSIEFWTRAVQQGAYAAELPYLHWAIPRAQISLAGNISLAGDAAATPTFEGTANQNINWSDGPLNDWVYPGTSTPAPSDRVWQYIRTATLPDLTPGYRAVA